MDLEIQQREKEGIRILDLRGRLAIGERKPCCVTSVSRSPKPEIGTSIFNFEDVKEIDEPGLDALAFCSSVLRGSSGALKLLNLKRVHINLIVLMGLEAAFEVFVEEQDAVNSFFPERAVRHFDILEFVKEHRKKS